MFNPFVEVSQNDATDAESPPGTELWTRPPATYHLDPKLSSGWVGVASREVPTGDGQTYLEAKVRGIPEDCAIVLVTGQKNVAALQALVERHNHFGREADSFQYCCPPQASVLDSVTGDFVEDVGGRVQAEEGSLYALLAVLESGIGATLLDYGVRWAQVSFMENSGATFDPTLLSMLMLSGKVVLTEITTWEGEAGPLAIKFEGRPVLLEREQISDPMFDDLRRRPGLVGGVGTNAYLLDLSGFLAWMGVSREHLSAGCAWSRVRSSFDQIGRSLLTIRSLDGNPVVYKDHRLSVLTLAFESLFVDVPRSRYVMIDSGEPVA